MQAAGTADSLNNAPLSMFAINASALSESAAINRHSEHPHPRFHHQRRNHPGISSIEAKSSNPMASAGLAGATTPVVVNTASGTTAPRRAFVSRPLKSKSAVLLGTSNGEGICSPNWRRTMTVHGIRRSALIMLASCAAAAAHAETSRPHDGEFVMLDQPAVFYMNPNSGSLKESVQKGQQLVWHLKDKLNERRFQLTNMSVGFLRSETGGQVQMTFTGNISSLGHLTSEEAKLNAIVRAKGGASLHAWSFNFSVKCADKDQPLTPLTHDVPDDLAQNIFANVSTVEIVEPAEPNFPGVRVQRCS
jgi:hypothetical protein